MSEQNRALLRHFYEEVVNQKRLAALDEMVAADFVDHEELPPGLPGGPEGAKQLFAMLHRAFPDLQANMEDYIAEGDRVVARGTFSGTHRGEFMGVPPTGRRVSFAVIDIVRFAGGKLAEHWGLTDDMSLMQQLGVVSTPG